MFSIYWSGWIAALIALALGIACLPFFAWADSDGDQRGRAKNIDGLRGFLALAVMMHHVAIYWAWNRTGVWAPPPSNVYSSAGSVGVGLFFMITAYLFWGRVLRSKRMDWIGLYLGRFFRIAPLYWAVAVTVVVISVAHVGAISIKDVIRWAALGVLTPSDIGGYPSNHLVAGVTWTLRYEWFFYIALMPLSLLRRWRLTFTCVGLVASLSILAISRGNDPSPAALISLFFFGMLGASLDHAEVKMDVPQTLSSAVVLVLILATAFGFHSSYQVVPIILLGGAFLLLLQGATVFGLLNTRPAIRLGNISFGIYLIHGLCLFGAFSVTDASSLSALAHWGVAVVAMILTLIVSLIAHRWIEQPGISLGKFVVPKVRSFAIELTRDRGSSSRIEGFDSDVARRRKDRV